MRNLLLALILLISSASSVASSDPLVSKTSEPIRVAFALSPQATVIDFAGPWEVFQDVTVLNRDGSYRQPFELYTVAGSTQVLRATAGLQIVPDFSFETAPQPNVVVIPAQRGSSDLHQWLRKVSEATDLMMSVCTGAFQLAHAGLLAGKSATTHHDFLDQFAKKFPNVELKRDVRWVDNGDVASAAGLTSGIDLALHVVERYFGKKVASQTAIYMEHSSQGWMDPKIR